MKKIFIFVSVLILVAVPLVSLAQYGVGLENIRGVNEDPSAGCFARFQSDGKIGGLFAYITCLIQYAVIPLIFALAIAIFVWGVVQYVINRDEEAKKEKGKQFMIWGIIGLTVMIGVWGLVRIVGNTFDVDTNVLPSVKPN